MSSKRDEAVDLLQHYFAIAMGKKSSAELDGDERVEIASIVDLTIAAARESLQKANVKERPPGLSMDW
jgi:hypothetical protein